MKNRPYLLTKDQVRWHLSDAQKNKAINSAIAILDDPNASNRAKGIAMKNLILMNAQNIQTVMSDEDSKTSNIQITIKEE